MALIGGWVPNMAQAWMSFTALYLVILLVTTLFFNAMFKKEEQKYKAAFEKYQASRRA